MILQQYPPDHKSRTERRRAAAQARRSRKKRRVVIAIAVAVILVCIAGAGWFGYRLVAARRKPPPLKTYKVVIPEGLNIKQTAEKVASQCEITADEFLAATGESYDEPFLAGSNGTLEGFLFPKTYEVTSLTTGRQLVTKLLDQFQTETEGLDWSGAEAKGLTRYQAVIVASLIEREAKLAEERPVVASVIYNRLKKDMKLQLCSSVEYALGTWKEKLTYDDLEVDSPYNTYKVSGLPPGPICNPGFESIRAALYPGETEYLYFILTSADGRHSFTADYNEFLRWKNEQNKK